MRDELHLMELVDRYLDGSMNAEERAAFETRAGKSQELRDLIEDQRALREGVARVPVRAAAAKAFRAYRFGKPGPWIGGAVVVAIIAASSFFLLRAFPTTDTAETITAMDSLYEHVLDDTTGTRLDPLVINVDPRSDTTLLTPNGIVLDIPQGCFVDELRRPITSPVRVTLIEALDPLDIMKAGLSTMSGDTLLETGGMFYFDAHANGKAVMIDPTRPITAMVPTADAKKDMMLYQGVKMPDGRIDWRNPKPLKKSLVPVDITTLDFYPPGYEAKLAELGQDVTNKEFKDSLYWSFTCAVKEEDDRLPAFPNQEETIEPLRFSGLGAALLMAASPEQAQVAWPIAPDTLFADFSNGTCGIKPTKVKAIWNSRFNNTNLATREFEERMRAIHGTCDNAVLDLYVNNLDKDLSELDARVGKMGHPEFDHFAERNDGRVDLPPHAAKRLSRFYEKWSRAEAEAIRKTQDKFWSEQAKLDRASFDRQNQQTAAEYKNDVQRFQREYEANLTSALDQLGIQKTGPVAEPPLNAYAATITNVGWWNIDQAVYAATRDRSTMTYVDPQSGKKATIVYKSFSVEVTDKKGYDEVNAYLIPRELDSYQRMTDDGFRFKEKLNRGFEYDLFCLANKGTVQYAGVLSSVHTCMDTSLSLVEADEATMSAMLVRIGACMEERLIDEARFQRFMTVDRSRQRANDARAELRQALLPVVFPCGVEAVPSEPSSRPAAGIRDRSACFPGGRKALSEYLTVKQRSPVDPFDRFIEGNVEVRFWVLEDGSIGKVSVSKPLFWSADDHARDLIRNMPRWVPCIRNGKPQAVEFAQDVRFVKGADAGSPASSR